MTRPPERFTRANVKTSQIAVGKSTKASDTLAHNNTELDTDSRTEVVVRNSQTSLEMSAGPIPPPSVLKAYEDAYSGCAERILRMAELDQKHLQEMERNRINYPHQYAMRGQLLGFAALIVMIGVATYLFILGHNREGFALLGTTALAVLTIFVRSRIKL